MIDHSDIEFLHAFSSHEIYIVELRRLDRDENSQPEEVCFWLMMNRGSIERLTLISKDSEEDLEVREFSNGVLSFDDQVGEFLLETGDSFALDRIGKRSMEKAIKKCFIAFLQSIEASGSK